MSGLKKNISDKLSKKDIGLDIYPDGVTIIQWDTKYTKRIAEIELTRGEVVRMIWKLNKYMLMGEWMK